MRTLACGKAIAPGALLVLAACGHPATQPPPASAAPALASLVVKAEPAAERQVWDGTVEAVNAAVLSAQTNARVLDLPYDVNDVVPEGAVLVRFTDVEQKSASRAAQAQIAAARAAYTDARLNYERVAAIAAKGLIARRELDQALAQRDSARAALAAAEATSRQVGMQADYTVVRAPYAGIVTHRYVEVGESVQAGPPVPQRLIALASLKDLRVTAQVPQSSVDAIRRYRAAEILLDGPEPRSVPATKVTVFPYADPATHSFAVRAEFKGDGTGLYPGMTVKVAFATGQTEHLRVPAGALVRQGELQGVYVIGDAGVTLRQVRVGERDGGSVELLAGLDGGERIALDPPAAVRWLTSQRQRSGP
ncbi:efflux RND transporter periplasmic adaptor subunit [Luteibacter yeojuensis]|uniref:Efflux RND transporter periplasmic adaptor subunit n=1 Tax=Luteibacter yeojuensis TaxID=345309 RepID=A0A7X5QVS6_9GAMM|nr:efflux RND transporter periplasmic adaptor subunit [Luteibacter yeojuensis]NID16342.1 efflux RND transporter periplasmic adaptor subunit [Luteibacter yeojuensis]